MGIIKTQFFDRVRYTLRNKNLEPLVITEPIGWSDDEKEFVRNEQYHGIFINLSNNLKFIDNGADYIQMVLDIYGINEDIELIKEEKHPKTDVWTVVYSGFLDLSTYTKQNNQISIKFNTGGITQLLKSRESEKVEIDRLTTLDGKPIPALQPFNITLENRNIFLKSTLENNKPSDIIFGNLWGTAEFKVRRDAIPLKIIAKSHEELSDIAKDTYIETPEYTTNMALFFKSKAIRALDFDFKMSFKTNMVDDNHISGGGYIVMIDVLNENKDSIYNIPLFSCRSADFRHILGGNAYGNNGNNHNVEWRGKLNLNIGDSVAITVLQFGYIGYPPNNGGVFKVQTENIVSSVTIKEDSKQDPTTANLVYVHNVAERLSTIITNKENVFYSDFLGKIHTTDINGRNYGYKKNGTGSYNALTHGFWVRGFDKLPPTTDDYTNLFKPLTTSFREFVNSLSAVWNLGLGIEKQGFNDVIRLEKLSYFYNKNTTIRLPNQIKNIKRTLDSSKYYSSLEFGYIGGGKYEEACGLDEYNAKSTFTTPISKVKNTYSKLSEYRADSYGMEFARRKQKDENDIIDTPYDDVIFMLDLIDDNGKIRQRKWADDLVSPPTGLYGYNTATNLRLSPVNCMNRHAWWFSGCLQKYITEKTRYASSEGNSQLTTEIRTDASYGAIQGNVIGDGYKYSENGDVINSQFERARFVPEIIEFEHICDFEVMQQITDTTIVNGNSIPNFYGLVEFINEKNELEKGFLISLKPNGKGVWTILKSNTNG